MDNTSGTSEVDENPDDDEDDDGQDPTVTAEDDSTPNNVGRSSDVT